MRKRKKRLSISGKLTNETLEKKVKEVIVKLREEIKENERLCQEVHQLLFNIAKAFATAVEAKDHYSRGHTDRVTHYSLAIADELPASLKDKEDDDFMKCLHLASVLHDIGKIGIRDEILGKNGHLTEEEWVEMKKHPQIGAEILSPILELKKVSRNIKYHHERIDGKGYPDGLKGEEIPLVSRIIAVADAFEAMTAMRPYRNEISEKEAIEELKRCRGTQFDSRVIEAFIRAYKKGKLKGGFK